VLISTGANGATTRSILAPNQSKIYIVINQATGSVIVKGVTGPTTGVTVPAGKTTLVVWAGSDFVEISPGTSVTSVTGTAPVVSSGGLTPAISMAAATASVSGYLTNTDWNTFNDKQALLVSGTNLKTINSNPILGSGNVSVGTVTAVTANSPMVSTGGTTPTISIPAATSSTNGYLINTDWTTFNSKYSPGGALGTPSSGNLSNCTSLNLSYGVSGILPVNNGGTGYSAPSLISGTNISISGSWPNQTINNTFISDIRDKTNFSNVPYGLSFVNELKPTAYQFKASREDSTPEGQVKYGFIAQDILTLEGSNPVIINNEDLDRLRINPECIIPVLVNAIKELTTRLETLENKVN
jgi:hypothetical protein